MTFSVAPPCPRLTADAPAKLSAASGDNSRGDQGRAAPSPVALTGPAPHPSSLARCVSCASRRIGICSSLEDRELPALAIATRKADMLSGRVVMNEGDPADTVYTVLSGMLKLYKSLPDGRQQITGFATAGDVIGLAVGDVYAYSAETVSPANLCRMQTSELRRLLMRSPALQARLFALTSVELSAAQDQILLLGCKTASERVATFLLALANRVRKGAAPDQENPVVFLPMTKADIGAYLGLRPETLSRVFRKLEDGGSITRVSKDRIRLDDMEALRALATVSA